MWQVAAMVVGAMFLIVAGDTAGTVLTRDGASPFFVAWSRFAVAVVVLAPFCGVSLGEVRRFVEWRLLLRGLLIVCGISSILTALTTEPIANVFGAFFVSPIVAFVLSNVLFREKAGWMRAILLVVSFAGVLIVVRPGFGMTVGIGFALLAGLFHGSYLVATKWVAADYRPRFLLLSQLTIGAVLLAPFGIGLIPELSWLVVLLVLISALGSAFGNLLIVLASRVADASLIAALIYSQLIHAAFLGWLAFGEWPDMQSFVGLTIIFVAGLSTILLARKPAPFN